VSAERLQKVLAAAGVASRRDCEELIRQGRITVNGRVMRELGARVDPDVDSIAVDGVPVSQGGARTYIMLHKPLGVVSTVDDPQGRPTVIGLVKAQSRLFPVGRLDMDSEGLLLLTDDGDLAYRLTHPSFAVEKEYRVLLQSAPSPEALRAWREGVELEGQQTAPAWVELVERTPEGAWVRVVLREGRKRQVREVAALLGYEVLRLIRVREGPLLLGDLPVGTSRPLSEQEVEALRKHTGESRAAASDAGRSPKQPEGRPPRRATGNADEGPARRERGVEQQMGVANERRRTPRSDQPQRGERPDSRPPRPDTRGPRPAGRAQGQGARYGQRTPNGNRARAESGTTRDGRDQRAGARDGTRYERPGAPRGNSRYERSGQGRGGTRYDPRGPNYRPRDARPNERERDERGLDYDPNRKDSRPGPRPDSRPGPRPDSRPPRGQQSQGGRPNQPPSRGPKRDASNGTNRSAQRPGPPRGQRRRDDSPPPPPRFYDEEE
jgi:23S rRNA pseudouridine2605 synthase